MTLAPIHVVGGGLAGSEAAWQIAQAGVPVVLHEMRPVRGTPAHQTDKLAELVCSNSFRADDWTGNAVGLLHPPLATVSREEVAGLPPAEWDSVIVSTGPLTSPALSEAILKLSGEGQLAFFDAIAPIVHLDSINMDIAWRQSRYDKEGPGG